MQELAGWAGHWRGEGWMRMGPGEPMKFTSEEWVEERLDGQALIIEGLHHDLTSGRVGHHALAMLTWDEAAEVYRFRTYVTGRGSGDFEGRIEDDTFVWGGTMGPGEMRYTIRIDGDSWHEVGDFSRDGESWDRFFEMTLKRVGD